MVGSEMWATHCLHLGAPPQFSCHNFVFPLTPSKYLAHLHCTTPRFATPRRPCTAASPTSSRAATPWPARPTPTPRSAAGTGTGAGAVAGGGGAAAEPSGGGRGGSRRKGHLRRWLMNVDVFWWAYGWTEERRARCKYKIVGRISARSMIWEEWVTSGVISICFYIEKHSNQLATNHNLRQRVWNMTRSCSNFKTIPQLNPPPKDQHRIKKT